MTDVGEVMVGPAPERIEVKSSRVGEFERELRRLLQEAASGKYDAELRSRGITVPVQIPPDEITNAIEPKVNPSQGASPDQFIDVLIKYAPLIIGRPGPALLAHGAPAPLTEVACWRVE